QVKHAAQNFVGDTAGVVAFADDQLGQPTKLLLVLGVLHSIEYEVDVVDRAAAGVVTLSVVVDVTSKTDANSLESLDYRLNIFFEYQVVAQPLGVDDAMGQGGMNSSASDFRAERGLLAFVRCPASRNPSIDAARRRRVVFFDDVGLQVAWLEDRVNLGL